MGEIKSSRKSNTFVDKRFGEGDANMSLEEKMFLRFQKEKVKKAKNLSIYNLDVDDNDAILTHKGTALGASNMGEDGDWSGSDDDDDKRLGKEVVNSLHFGGGLVPKASSSEAEHHKNHNKSKAEILQEIVMKSKLHKMERREAKDAQETQREDIDKQFEALLASSDVQMDSVSKYNRRSGDNDAIAGKDEFADYDAMYGEMQYDTKAQPSDRTKTPEEIALAAREKLQRLEDERQKRMNMDEDLGEDGVDLALIPKSKKRRANDDEIDEFGDNYGWNNRDDGDNATEDGQEDNEDELDDGTEEDDVNVNDSDVEDDSEDGIEEDDDDDECDEDSEVEAEFDRRLQELLVLKAQQEVKTSKQAALSGSKTLTKVTEKTNIANTKQDLVKPSKALNKETTIVVNSEMPHSIECPSDITEFEELVEKYVVNPAIDFKELLNRILVWNSIHLPGHQGTDNKPRMHNFMDVLVKYFIQMGNELKGDSSVVSKFTMCDLDFVAVSIYKLAQDMPEAATALFGRTLGIMHSQMEKRLRDYVQGTLKTTCWPSLGQLLLLQVLGSVYSVTDFRNSMVVSMSMFLCQCLTQCPIASLQDLSHAVLACSIQMGFTAEMKRFVPEVITVVSSILSAFGPAATSTLPKWSKIVNRDALSAWVVESNRQGAVLLASSKTAGTEWADFKWDYFSDLAGGAKGTALHGIVDRNPYGALAVIHALAVIVRDCHRRYSLYSSYSEIMSPISAVLGAVVTTIFPSELKISFEQLKQSISDTISSCRSARKPLAWRGKVTTAIPSLVPRYEVNYTMKKDMDPDQARVQVKQLQRQVKREKKAAMRELRRDADFVGQETYKAQQAVKERKRAERNSNFAWMEQEQGVINEQVRKGGELLRGGGSRSVKPIKRVKRGKR